MKRMLALLLCLTLMLPVLASAEFEEEELDLNDLFDAEDVDLNLDNEGGFVIGGVDGGEEDLIPEGYVDEPVDTSALYINTELPDHVINILLLGVDVRGSKDVQILRDQIDPEKAGPGGVDVMLCDVVMILSINLDDGSLKLTSIARDLKVDIPGHGSNKINYAFGDRHFETVNGERKYKSFTVRPELTMATINRNFEMNIQYYVATNFHGVEEIIEYLGGVDVELTRSEADAINAYITKNGRDISGTYDNHSQGRIALQSKKGVQHLDGLQALLFARLRHVDGGNDLQRTGRTRRLLENLMHPVVTRLNNGELDLMNLLGVVSTYFISNMNLMKMVKTYLPVVLGNPIMSNFDDSTSLIEEYRIPESKKYHYSDDGKFVLLNNTHAAIEALHNFIYGAYYAPKSK